MGTAISKQKLHRSPPYTTDMKELVRLTQIILWQNSNATLVQPER